MALPRERGLSPVPLDAMDAMDGGSANIVASSNEPASRTTLYQDTRTLRRGNSPAPLHLQVPNIVESTIHQHQPAPTSPNSPNEKKDVVTWMSLPNKSQLAILTVARLSEPITQTSLVSYLYHQLASFEPDASPATVATHVGFVVAAFPATQAFTSVLWGLMADSPRIGRKWVLVIGLLGTAVGSIGYGLSLSWQVAMFWRAFAGILNGNVGVMRTMISEIVREKKYQSRAFLLMPMCFNFGTVIGPTLGGWLANPVEAYPGVFGPGSFFGGEDGVWWMKHWPYALPNFISATFLVSAACWVIFGLDETHEARRDLPDWGRSIGRAISRALQRLFTRSSNPYERLDNHEEPDTPGYGNINHEVSQTAKPKKRISTPNKLPIKRMWTRNVLANLLSRFLLSLTVGTFQTLWFTFLSAPRSSNNNNNDKTSSSIFHFSGGLGLSPPRVGTVMAVLGSIGVTLQLTSYPAISARLGTTGSFRRMLPLFPIVCVMVPFLAILPSTSPAPAPMDGPFLWLGLLFTLSLYVVARTFVLPASAILVNNCAPHPSRLGTLHGVAQSIGAGARFLGPVIGGTVFGAGQNMGIVGLAWWVLAGVGAVTWAVSGFVREGDGHEILMDGEVRKEDGEVVYVGTSPDER